MTKNDGGTVNYGVNNQSRPVKDACVAMIGDLSLARSLVLCPLTRSQRSTKAPHVASLSLSGIATYEASRRPSLFKSHSASYQLCRYISGWSYVVRIRFVPSDTDLQKLSQDWTFISRSKSRNTRIPPLISESFRSQMLYRVELRAPEKSNYLRRKGTAVK